MKLAPAPRVAVVEAVAEVVVEGDGEAVVSNRRQMDRKNTIIEKYAFICTNTISFYDEEILWLNAKATSQMIYEGKKSY